MKTLILGVLVTLILTTFVFVMFFGAVVAEAVLWVGRRRAGKRN